MSRDEAAEILVTALAAGKAGKIKPEFVQQFAADLVAFFNTPLLSQTDVEFLLTLARDRRFFVRTCRDCPARLCHVRLSWEEEKAKWPDKRFQPKQTEPEENLCAACVRERLRTNRGYRP